MRPRHRVSRNAIELIKRFEGYRRKAAQLPDGRWTIGYGHTLTAREGAEVSEDDAEALLIYDLIGTAHLVNETTLTPLTQNQFDALCSFAFNLGADSFRSSQVLKRLNAGQHLQAACAMELWRKAEFEGERIVIDALVRRRAAEKALFLTPPGDAWVPAPSPVLRPLIDAEARELIPSQTPAEVRTSFEGETVLVTRDGEVLAVPPPVEDEPGTVIAAAAEAVTARLQTIFPNAGEEPAAAELAAPESLAEDEAPQPIILTHPEAPEAPSQTDKDFEAPSAIDPVAEVPSAVAQSDVTATPFQPVATPEPPPFIPSRAAPPPRPAEGNVVWDLLVALFGFAFFGFGLYWYFNAQPDPAGGFVNPLLVAWSAGVAGIILICVAVYRLLMRLSRVTERD